MDAADWAALRVSGVITHMYRALPIGLITIALVLGRIRESSGPRAALDVVGLALAGLASLGIVWGLASVVLLLAYGQGLGGCVLHAFLNMGNNVIVSGNFTFDAPSSTAASLTLGAGSQTIQSQE